MSDYCHVKALRYKLTEADVASLANEIETWKIVHPEQAAKYSFIHDVDDWGSYIEFIKFPRAGKKTGYFSEGYTDADAKYLDYVLCHDYGVDSDEWYRARYTTANEQAKYKDLFKAIFQDIDMSRVHVVDYCWYNCCEPCDVYDPQEDEFYKEV